MFKLKNSLQLIALVAVTVVVIGASQTAYSTEKKLKAEAITKTLQGNTAYLNNGATQSFYKDGKTLYLAANGGLERGSWNTQGDKYCSQWSGRWSCYDMTGDGKQAITWQQGATKYPARMVSGIHLKE